MLPKKNRLNLSKKGDDKFKGSKIFGEDFNFIYKKSNYFKAAIVISKKVAPRAVDRNRIKRIISEALRGQKLKGELIIFVKKNISNFKKQEIDDKIQRIIGKINI